jgi:CBS domain-containing protein
MHLTDFTIGADATLLDAVAKINKNGSRTVLVVEDGKLTGLISEGDVLRALLRGMHPYAPAHEVANRAFRFLASRDREAAFRLFQEHAFGLVPVVDDAFGLVDVITLEQVLAEARWADDP